MQSGEAKALHTNHRSSGIDTSDPSLQEAWEDVRNDATGLFFSMFLCFYVLTLYLIYARSIATNFCIFTYSDENPSLICVYRTGEGGLGELEGSLSEDHVLYGGVRLTMGSSAKFYSFMRVGANISGMKRAKAGMHKNGILNVLEGVSGEIPVDADASFEEALNSYVRDEFSF